MATIAVQLPKSVTIDADPVSETLAPACTSRRGTWAAIDVDVEQNIEVRLQRRMSFKEHLFSFLVDYNRH